MPPHALDRATVDAAPAVDTGAVADRAGDAVSADGRRDGAAAGPTRLRLRVFDSRTQDALPAKVSLWALGRDGARTPVTFGNLHDPQSGYCADMGSSLVDVGEDGGALATWSGIALWRGEATIPIGVALHDFAEPGKPPALDCDGKPHDERIEFGRYELRITRGLEYDITTQDVDLFPDRGVVDVAVPLSHTVDTSGYFAADMHVHSSAGSGDSLVKPEHRVMSEVATGIEVMVSSDHDFLTDYGPIVSSLFAGVAHPPIVSVVGNEATGSSGHFNAMPVAYDASAPRHGVPSRDDNARLSPETLFARLHGLGNALGVPPLVQVNHPRLNGYYAYFDSGACGSAGWTNHANLPDCSLDFEALEVMNGFLACNKKIRDTLDDWYALLRFGVVVTATGNSDTHYTSGILAGFPRTYVRVAEDTAAAFDEGEFVTALRQQRALATTGPFVTLTVDGSGREGDLVTAHDGRVTARIRMQAASWVHPDTIRLKLDGADIATWPVDDPLAELATEVLITNDAALTVEVEGRRAMPSWLVGEFVESWKFSNGDPMCKALPGTDQGMVPFAVTNAVLVDADGDGHYRGALQPRVFPAPVPHPVPIPPLDSDCMPTLPR